MKLPQFIRKLVPFSIAIYVLSILGVIYFAMSGWRWPTTVSGILAALSFVILVGGARLVRSLENAILRRFGQPATATVLDFYSIEAGMSHGHTLHDGVRVKLQVQPPGSASFIAVAEEDYGLILEKGESFSVKYDPRTQEVALVIPRQVKTKEKKDF